ncbi:heavy-metal-associated domain-containing protein [Flavobacterium chilense]|uniref:Copper chaperone CopZ n=1 Tax=Flavobacterium chilense TaxID=946677 RepID=A0A1M7MET7_9FLAO|nr:heavy-metal-associated domain-containing protein [Flavobacterium chilense]SHM88875.1 Copper chaperone CopZ [Flavobacterium chilense]|tara:strand:+ start:26645 stop:27004 length:360 start_codon:yes stop_codon:yes gene_type:complete
MKKYFLIPIVGLALLSFQANAQCCHPVELQSKLEKSNQQVMKTVQLKITGMTCAGCSNHVSSALKKTTGVIEQIIQYPGDIAIINFDATKTSPEKLIKVIETSGYKAVLIKETNSKKKA